MKILKMTDPLKMSINDFGNQRFQIIISEAIFYLEDHCIASIWFSPLDS